MFYGKMFIFGIIVLIVGIVCVYVFNKICKKCSVQSVLLRAIGKVIGWFGIILGSILIVSCIFGELHVSYIESPGYYYKLLEKKTYIEEELKDYKKEIEAIQSGEVEGVPFKNKTEIINLDKKIKEYNELILTNKQNYELYKKGQKTFFNEKAINLKEFDTIF